MITDEEIRATHKQIIQGKKVKDAVEELGVSRAYYYLKIKELGLSTKRENEASTRAKKHVTKIKDMHDLAQVLNLSYKEVFKYVDTNKDLETNVKRMQYLKDKSPLKYIEAINTTILNYYKIYGIKLIELLNK